MLYWIIKPFVLVFFRIYYRYDYRGRKNIPYGVPVVFAPNHVNAFIDPIAIGILCRQKVRFFARGDVFRKKFAAVILNSMGVSPVFRIQEGFSEIKKNDKTFEECLRRLSNNETILMFPEAICVQERKLRPLKKGVSRIVFQALESFEYKKDVMVVPVGLNYTKAWKFRSKLFIDFGEPISMMQYAARYKEDKVRAINEFTKVLEAKMTEHMLILDNYESEKLLECIEEIYLDQWMTEEGVAKNLGEHYNTSRKLAGMLNDLDKENPAMTIFWKEKITHYIRRVRAYDLRDHLLRPENIEKISIGGFILEFFVIWLGMLFYSIGWLTSYPPYFLAKTFADKKIRSVEFYASVYANFAMILWVVFYMLELLAVALIFRNWNVLAYTAALIPCVGLFTVWFYSIKEKIFGRWRLLRMVRKERSTVEELIHERSAIIEALNDLKKKYLNKKS